MPPAEALVPSEGWISDDSSFYGDCETIDALEKRSSSFNAAQYWSAHEGLISTIAHQARAAASPSSTLNSAKGKGNSAVGASADSKELVYPHEGNELFYQPSESVSGFLKRCPPHTTIQEESGIHWFWVDNPHKSAHDVPEPVVQTFTDAGDNLLDDYRKRREELEKKHPGMNKASITKKLIKDRENLKQQLAELARDTNVVCGKWLVFPHWDDLPRLWKQVCFAVLENRLGPAAKVATKSQHKSEPYGVIIIYTKDCFDVDDVRRVLLALVDLGVVSDRDDAKGIWYKMDAYTYIQLNSGNEFNLPASLYSSKDMLKNEGRATKRKAEEMQPPQSKSPAKQRSITSMFR